ncbi:MAG: RNA polymerase subunit sigma-24, partial [Verrucomicrobia bacterium]
ACEYFLAKEWRNATRLKRGGRHQILSLDVSAAEDWYQNEPADQMSPERLYERQWVLSLLELALERLRQEWLAAGKEALFATLQLFLSGERKSMTCARAAFELGMSEGAVRTAVHRLRQQYFQILRAEVGQTLSREDDLEEELRHLLSVI